MHGTVYLSGMRLFSGLFFAKKTTLLAKAGRLIANHERTLTYKICTVYLSSVRSSAQRVFIDPPHMYVHID